MLRNILVVALLIAIITGCKKTEMQQDIDERIIVEYLQKNNITATRTSSGLYYVITDSTADVRPVAGKKVIVNYTGKFLDDRVFDSSTDGSFIYTYGRGEMIPGFDEGVGLMRKGEKGIFLLPSRLAYGSRGTYGIPANTVLRFDIELLNIQ